MNICENNIHVGISYMYEPSFNRALLPLLQAGDVDALEWSFDTVKDFHLLPDWTRHLFKEFSEAGRLYGHGVYYSIFAGQWHDRHSQWLNGLEKVLKEFRFRHISEHFGFMTSGNAHEGAPLPVPFCYETLDLGVHRLKQMHQLTEVPVGLENLAFSFSLRDVQQQGIFLEQLVTPVNGFVLLDLHNIYCQSVNFGMDARELIAAYPLHRVKEIHVSGGSWEDSAYATAPVRRDTHDNSIPEEVFALLDYTLPLCPYTDVVIMERLGDTLRDEQEEAQLREDFLRVKQVVRNAPLQKAGQWPVRSTRNDWFRTNAENSFLHDQQTHILKILKSAADAKAAHRALTSDKTIDQELWQIANWRLPMIETAMLLGQKWGIQA